MVDVNDVVTEREGAQWVTRVSGRRSPAQTAMNGNKKSQ